MTYPLPSSFESGLAATDSTHPWCPWRMATAPSPEAPLSAPARTSWRTIRASSDPEYSHWLSGDHESARTAIACAVYVAITLVVATSTTCTWPVSMPIASCLPSGDCGQLHRAHDSWWGNYGEGEGMRILTYTTLMPKRPFPRSTTEPSPPSAPSPSPTGRIATRAPRPVHAQLPASGASAPRYAASSAVS